MLSRCAFRINSSTFRLLLTTGLVSPAAAAAAGLGVGLWGVSPRPVYAAGFNTIRLEPDRRQILADGKSTATLTARVYDSHGAPVGDNTLVRFATTAGRLESDTVRTQNGIARVVLIAAALPASATVTANVDGAAPANVVIAFGSDPDAAYSGNDWIRLTGSQYVGYIADFGIIHAIGKNNGARLRYRGVEIRADELQYNVRENRVRARGNVVLRGAGSGGGEQGRVYSSLRYDLLTFEGIAERDQDGRPMAVTLAGPLFGEQTTPAATTAPAVETAPASVAPANAAPAAKNGDTAAATATAKVATTPAAAAASPSTAQLAQLLPDAFQLEEVAGARLTIVARAIDLEPNQKLQFRRATFYLDGTKTLSLPFHVMALGQETLFSDEVVGYGPGGITFDFPLYYDVRPSAIGTLHLRRGERFGGSAYATRPGWTLDIEHAYNAGTGKRAADGTLAFSGLTRRDWNARWSHSQNLDGATRGQVYLDVPAGNGFFGNALVTRQFSGFRLNLSVSGSRTAGISVPILGDPTQPLPAGGNNSGSNGVLDPITGQPLPPGATPVPGTPTEAVEQILAGVPTGNLRGHLYAETDAQTVPGAGLLRYSLSGGTTRQAYFGKNALAPYNVQNIGVRLFTAPIALPGGRTRLTPLLSVGQEWISGGATGSVDSNGVLQGEGRRSGLSLLGTLSLNHGFGRLGTGSLVYDYAQRPQLSTLTGGRQRLAMNLFLGNGERWTLSLAGAQTLDGGGYRNLLSSLGFAITGPWRGQITFSSTAGRNFSYNDAQFALIRRIGARDIAVYYSTAARKFQFDLTGARF